MADEKPSDSAVIVAQDIWGLGNLSPFDHLFASTAIMNLVPKLSMGFIGRHLGRRFHRYAEDTGIWIDAFEANMTLSRLHKKKNTTIRLNEWHPNPALLKKDRYSAIVVVQQSTVSPSLEAVYAQSANGLKSTGKLFAADLMCSGFDGRGEAQREFIEGLGARTLHTFDEHKDALAAVGLVIEDKHDLSDSLLAAVRSGLQQSVKALGELRSLDEPSKSQRRLAFRAQIEIWAMLHALMQKRQISAIGVLAGKRGQPAPKP